MTIYVFNTSSRRVMHTYEAPYMEGLIELLDSSSIPYTIDPNNRTDIQNIYVDEEGQLQDLHTITSEFTKLTIDADGEDTTTLSTLPADTEVYVDGSLVYTGNSFVMAVTEDGVYHVVVKAHLHHDKHFMIEAV